jgi:TRAP-type uncharacterized transport system substrate-binding protein
MRYMKSAMAGLALAGIVLAPAAASAQQAPQPAPAPAQAKADASKVDWDKGGRQKINEWTIGIAAGRTEGAPLRFAAELARALDDGASMRLLPIVTRGPFDNMADLLMLRGVDAAILFGDTLEHFQNVEKVPRLLDRVNYVANLVPSEVHVFARPEIKSLKDLEGKAVNFNSAGTAAAYTGPLIFKKLGIKVKETFDPHPAAMREMRQSDKYAATFWVTTKPIEPLAKGDFPEGFKLLPVPYAKELEDLYLPATLESADYPKLVPQGQKVETVSVPTVLAVYNWPSTNERHKRMVRFVDYFFERLPQLQKPPFDPAWKNVNLAAPVPGWKRYGPVQQKLDSLAAAPKTAAKTN